MRVGVVGIGVMGEPMAKNLYTSGHNVTVYNRTKNRCDGLLALGIAVADTARQVIENSDAIILMVPTQVEVDQALERSDKGMIACPVKGKTIVLMSTVAPAYSAALAASLETAGARYVEAPVSGSRQPAETGQLVILAAAASTEDIDKVQTLFDAIGKKTVRCGPVPKAMHMKLANQLLLIAYFEAITEATHFAKGLGLDVAQFLAMAQAGPLANDVLRMKAHKMLSDDFTQQAPIRHVAKDIGLVCDEAARRDIWVPVAEANRALFSQAMACGQSQEDAVGVVKVLRNRPIPTALPDNKSHSVRIGVLCGLAVALIWSSWSVATRFAVTTSLGPHDVTFLRFGVSALLLWPILVRNGLGLKRIGLGRLTVMVLGAGVPFMLLGSIGMRYAPASHVATLMIGTMPIWVALLSSALFGERFSRRQWVGMGIVVAGVLCIGGYALLANRAAGEWRGDLLFLLAGLCFASFTIAQRRSGISPWHATALVNCLSALIFTPVYLLWLGPRLLAAPPAQLAFQVVAQGIAVAILGMFFYTEAVRRLGAPRAAIFGALAPALAVLIGMLFLGEVPAALTLLGIALVMGGVARVVTGGRTKPA